MRLRWISDSVWGYFTFLGNFPATFLFILALYNIQRGTMLGVGRRGGRGVGGNLCVHSGLSPYMGHSLFTHCEL